jgi:hypothetical protein
MGVRPKLVSGVYRFQVSGFRCQGQRVPETINMDIVTILRPEFATRIKQMILFTICCEEIQRALFSRSCGSQS